MLKIIHLNIRVANMNIKSPTTKTTILSFVFESKNIFNQNQNPTNWFRPEDSPIQ